MRSDDRNRSALWPIFFKLQVSLVLIIILVPTIVLHIDSWKIVYSFYKYLINVKLVNFNTKIFIKKTFKYGTKKKFE